jgi:hypothetical protein
MTWVFLVVCSVGLLKNGPDPGAGLRKVDPCGQKVLHLRRAAGSNFDREDLSQMPLRGLRTLLGGLGVANFAGQKFEPAAMRRCKAQVLTARVHSTQPRTGVGVGLQSRPLEHIRDVAQ